MRHDKQVTMALTNEPKLRALTDFDPAHAGGELLYGLHYTNVVEIIPDSIVICSGFINIRQNIELNHEILSCI